MYVPPPLYFRGGIDLPVTPTSFCLFALDTPVPDSMEVHGKGLCRVQDALYPQQVSHVGAP